MIGTIKDLRLLKCLGDKSQEGSIRVAEPADKRLTNKDFVREAEIASKEL